MRHMLAFTIFSSATLAVVGGCGGSTFTSSDGNDASTDGGGSDDATVSDSGGGIDAGGSSDGGDGHDSGATDSGGGADSGGATCTPACAQERQCCNGTCVNTDNDPENCGTCGTTCGGATPYCDGTCKAAPCFGGGPTCTGTTCCGSMCCTAGQICCKVDGPVTTATCFTPTSSQATCPAGCSPQCVSDRDAKTGIVPVEDRDVLEALASVPMSTWSYKTDDPNVRHLGPTLAQDLPNGVRTGEHRPCVRSNRRARRGPIVDQGALRDGARAERAHREARTGERTAA